MANGGDYRADLARQAEIRKREKALKDAGFREMLTAGGKEGGSSKYVNPKTGKTAGYAGAPIDITKGKLTDYGRGADEVISLKTLRSMSGVTAPAPKTEPVKPKTTSTTRPASSASATVSRPSAPTSSVPTAASAASSASPQATARAPDATSDAVVKPTTQPMQMANLTDEMDLTNKLKEIIDTNSPLFKAAQTKALQAMQARGIINSSLAQEAVMQSILNVALPIAQEEVQTLQQNLYYNTDWTNKDRQQANDYQYNSLLTKLQGRINQQLQEMTQSYAAWGKYGDWITQIITQQGADQDAWRRMLDAIRGAGGWPTISQYS